MYEGQKGANLEHSISNAQMKDDIKALVGYRYADSDFGAEEILRNGPHVIDVAKALGRKTKPILTDQTVREFIVQNYPVSINTDAIKIAKVSGDDHIVYYDRRLGSVEELTEEAYRNKIQEVGVDTAYENTYFSYVTDDPDWIAIRLYNLCADIPEMASKMLQPLDYMKTEWTDAEKIKMYALGLIAHEFVHRLQTEEVLAAYREIAMPDWDQPDDIWNGFPSEYSMFYRTKYNADEVLLLQEDLAESVQIFVINSEHLARRFPRRYDFIRSTFPHLVENSAVHTVLQL